VGAGVLTALAIIILPMLLDGTSDDRARVMATIPEPPTIELKKLSMEGALRRMREMEQESAAQLPELLPDFTPYDKTTAADENVSAGKKSGAIDLTLDKNSLPVSWSLQLGSFQDPKNAQRLRQQLRDVEYRTYIIRVLTADDNTETFRVYIGPMLKKNQLEAIAEEVRVKFKITGQIVRYRLEDDGGQLGG
jgi:cell division septation protein DedD